MMEKKKLGLLIIGIVTVLFLAITLTDFSGFTGKVIGGSDLSPTETAEAFFEAVNQGNYNNFQKLVSSQASGYSQLSKAEWDKNWAEGDKDAYQNIKVISESPPFDINSNGELHTFVEVKIEKEGQIGCVAVIRENGVWKILELGPCTKKRHLS